MMTDAKEILCGCVLGILFGLAGAACASADYVLAFHAQGCRPCAEMVPVENSLAAAGYTIRTVDVGEYPSMRRYYRVSVVPTYVYVVECGAGDYDSGCRIVGKCSRRQLESLCRMPYLATVGDVTRHTLRNVSLLLGGGL